MKLELLEDRTTPAGADMFANATVLTAAYPSTDFHDTATDNHLFTLELPNEPDSAILSFGSGGGTYSAWWKVVTPAPGMVTVDTIGSGLPNPANYADTTLEVLTGGPALNATSVSFFSDDDGGNGTSRITFAATGNTTYWFRANTYDAPTMPNAVVSTQFHFAYTADPQVLTSITRQTPAGQFTNANSVTFLATFNNDMQNVGVADFTTTLGTIASVNQVTASTYQVTVNGLGAANGVESIGLAPSASIQSLVGGYPLTSLTPTSPSESFTVDHIAPSVTSIVRQIPAASPATASDVTYRVTFSEPLAIGATNFSVDAGTLDTVTPVSGNPNAFDVHVIGLGAFSGTLTLSFTPTPIADAAGNALTSTTPTGTNNPTYILNPAPASFTLPVAGIYTLSRPSGNTAVLKNATNATVFSYDVTSTSTVTITGTAGDDTLNVDLGDGLAAHNPLTQTITFAAGANAGSGDKLKFLNTGA